MVIEVSSSILLWYMRIIVKLVPIFPSLLNPTCTSYNESNLSSKRILITP